MKSYILKTLTAIMLIAITVTAQDIWDGTVDTTWYTNNKSATEYTITTPQQLAGLAQLVNGSETNGTYKMSGKTIKLGNDIMLNDTTGWENWGTNNAGLKQWTAIGTNVKPFLGIFDGNGHVISGVYINNNLDCQGLFGRVGDRTIKNVGVVASYIKGGSYVGGLIGDNVGTVSNSYSTSTVSGSRAVGGLVGDNVGTVSNSYSTSTVSGSRIVGGLVGTNVGAVSNSYSTGAVTGTGDYVGGLVGVNDVGTVSNSYSTGNVSGSSNVGGLIGMNRGTVSNSYYDKETSGQIYSDGGISKTTVEMQSKDFLEDLNFVAGVLSLNAWVYAAGKYPKLSNVPASTIDIASYFAEGNGTESKPYIIKTKEHLEYLSVFVNMGKDFNGEYFKLGNDIMLNDTANWQNWATNNTGLKQWIAIGTGNLHTDNGHPFSGTFNGNSYIVSGVYINTKKDYQGLFGYLGSGGTINNTGILASYIKGGYYVGGLVGDNSSTISNSYSTGTVSGTSSYVGGLVGGNDGTINYSYSAGAVSGSSYVGGLVGDNSSTISNSYSAGTVSGTSSYVGGLAGGNRGTISYSYYDVETSGQTGGYGVGKTTADMKTQSTYLNWDFIDVWGIDPTINNGYPYLIAKVEEPTPIFKKITSNNHFITPTNNGINLTANNNVTLSVYSMSGKQISVQNYTAGNYKVSLSYLPKGMYIVKATSGSGRQVMRVAVR